MKRTGVLEHIRLTAKRIKKQNSHIPLGHVQHDLAVYLGFKKWQDLIKASPELIQERVEEKPLKELTK
jgi:hypothetical protein